LPVAGCTEVCKILNQNELHCHPEQSEAGETQSARRFAARNDIMRMGLSAV
jgi:hypothetical protein